MSYQYHPQYAPSRSFSADNQSYKSGRSAQSFRSAGSGRSGGGASGFLIKRTNSSGDEMSSSHLASHVDQITDSSSDADDGDSSLEEEEDSSSQQFGLVGRPSGRDSNRDQHQLNARRDMRTMSKATSADAARRRPMASPKTDRSSLGGGMHVYPSSSSRDTTSVRPASGGTSGGGTKKSARDLMRHQAGKARSGGVSTVFSFENGGSSAYSASGSGSHSLSRTSKTEVEKLKFRIKSRRNVSSNLQREGGHQITTMTDAMVDADVDVDAVDAVTPSPPMRRVRSNPLDEEQHDDPDLIGEDYHHNRQSKQPAVSSSRQHRLDRHAQRQTNGGQGRQQTDEPSLQSRRDFAVLATSSPATAASTARDGPHATIVKLRRQLDDMLQQNERSKTTLARSDAIILELRRDLREATVKLSKSEGERELIDRRASELESELSSVQRELSETKTVASAKTRELAMITDEVGRAATRDAVLGEMQLNLDRYEAKILTADMHNQQIEGNYRRDREEWEMSLARKEDELDKLRAELGGYVSNLKDTEKLWKEKTTASERKMRELEAAIDRLNDEMKSCSDREEALRLERDRDREALVEVEELRGDLDEAAKVLDDTRNALNEALDELAKIRKEKDKAECDRDFIREEMNVVSAKLEQETGEKNQLVKERNALRQENMDLKRQEQNIISRDVAVAEDKVAERELQIHDLSAQLSTLRDQSKQLQLRLEESESQKAALNKSGLVRTQMAKAEMDRAKKELEAKNTRFEGKLAKLEAERDKLKQSLDDAMKELELSDNDARGLEEYRKRSIKLDKKVKELDTVIIQRDSEILSLREQISFLEQDIQKDSKDSTDEAGLPSATSRARIENRRRASESKLRALMGQVAHSIDKRKDPDEFGSSRAILLSSDGSEGSRSEDESMIQHEQVQKLRLKLKSTEEALEITNKELDGLRRKASSSANGDVGPDNVEEERERIASLEMQLESANDLIRSREESSADLRNSLKEAVSLLKPLKDHVAQAEMQKDELRMDLERSRERISVLEKEAASRDDGSTYPSTSLKLQQKEQEVERLQKEVKSLKEALAEARSNRSSTQQNLDTLRGIKSCDESSTSSIRPAQASNQSTNEDSDTMTDAEAKRKLRATQKRILNLEQELESVERELNEKRDIEERLEETLQIKADLEAELSVAVGDLKAREEAEKTLNKSLKEAVDILKPLQRHVETVEKEKKILSKKLNAAENRTKELEEASSSRTFEQDKRSDRMIEYLEAEKDLLERRVHQLEREALDADQRTRASVETDMTRDVERLQEQFAEMEKKYNVTKNMLEQSSKTNASLLQDLKEMEEEDDDAQEQIALLEDQLEEKEKELKNAKYIATSALAKVDTLSVQSDEVASRGTDNISNRFLPKISEDDDAQRTIARLQEELRLAQERNDQLSTSMRQRDLPSRAPSRASDVLSANSELSVYHQFDTFDELQSQR